MHRGRNKRYSFQIDLHHGSSTLQFLQFWNQNVVNILFLVVKSLEVISGFISKLMKKISRWRHYWNIWHLSVKTKISPLLGCPQGSLGCQKMRHYPLNLDLEVWCSNIQTKLEKKGNSTKNQSFFMGSGGFFEVKVAWKYKFLTPVLFFFVFLLELGDWLECCFAVFAIPPGDLSSSSSIVSNTSSRSLDESSSSMESPRFFERCQSRKIKI